MIAFFSRCIARAFLLVYIFIKRQNFSLHFFFCLEVCLFFFLSATFHHFGQTNISSLYNCSPYRTMQAHHFNLQSVPSLPSPPVSRTRQNARGSDQTVQEALSLLTAADRAQQPALPVLSRAAWAASTTVAIGASCGRSISIRLTPSPHCPLAEGRGRASGGARPSPRARHRRHSPCLDRARPRAARSLARGRRARPRRAAAQWSWEKRAARRGWRAAR